MLTPWPAKAASPWISNSITAFRVETPRRAGGGAPCGRAGPSTTGLAISRCEGLKASAKCARAAGRFDIRGEPHVVLDVAGAALGHAPLAFELLRTARWGLADDVDQR